MNTTENKAAVDKGSENDSGADDQREPTLDELLDEGSTKAADETEQSAKAKPTVDDDEIDPKQVKQLLKREQEREYEAAVKRAHDDLQREADTLLKESEVSGINSKAVQGLIRQEAESDPRFMEAWAKRNSDPEAWAKVRKAFGKKLENEMAESGDPKLSDTRASVSAAVRQKRGDGQPATTPDTRDMGNSEFMAFSDNMFKQNAAKKGVTVRRGHM